MDRQAHQFMSFVESCFFYGSTVFSQWLSYVEETRNGDSHALHLRMTKFLPIWESCRRTLSWTWLDGVSERSLFTIHFWTKQEVLILLVHQKISSTGRFAFSEFLSSPIWNLRANEDGWGTLKVLTRLWASRSACGSYRDLARFTGLVSRKPHLCQKDIVLLHCLINWT